MFENDILENIMVINIMYIGNAKIYTYVPIYS